jgi:PAS domain S-box-containing protein
MAMALKEGRPVRGVEIVVERPDGSRASVLPSPTPLHDHNGRVVGAVNVLIDITHLKDTEDRLKLYGEIFTNSQDGIAIIDPTGHYVQQNPAHAELTGFDDEDLVDATPAIHLGDETFARIAAELQESGRFRDEVISHSKDGREVIMDLSAFAVNDTRGDVKYYVGIKRDVTARRRGEENSQRLGAIVESSADAIISKYLQGIVMSWNAGAEHVFGFTAQEATGRSIRMIIPPRLQSEEDELIQRVRRGERVENFETMRCRKDGTEIDVALTISPVNDRHGRIGGISYIARDITDRKAAEEAMRRSLTIKDQFASLVSHELRTPISTILGNGLLLLRREDKLAPEDKRQALADIVSEAERLQKNVEHLLLLSRLDAGELELEPLSLSMIVTRGVDSFRETHPARTLRYEDDDEIPPVLGQDTLVALVLQNLLANADKYSPPETPIDISLRVNESGQPEVRVRDYGIGVDEHDLENLFTPFYRSAKARGKASGLGLGLAVCKRALEAQKGSIAAQGRPEGGADFYFVLTPCA